MIIDNTQSNIEVIGDIKEFKTSIDPKNLEFITTLLSSNLYSDPEQSFIREIVSNAWDSHVEAGTTNIPVIIRFKGSYNNYSITIRDYGVGLSPERFKEVYCNIGSSTKRESNEFIGGFGIGKYSSLACSNTVYITSYYEGEAYHYIMIKSGNSITTNLVEKRETSEKNGVEVTIKDIKEIRPFDKALKHIVFFPNVYIDGAPSADKINSIKLKRFNNFATASTFIDNKLLLGNVLYPCNRYHLSLKAQSFLNRIDTTGIVIKFNVGELNITPNRESIIYSSDTIKKIEGRIEAAEKELNSMVGVKLTKDYDNLEEYYNMMSKYIYYDPVTDKLGAMYGYKIEPSELPSDCITYKGIDLRLDIRFIGNIFNLELPNFKGAVYNDKIYKKKMPWEISHADKVKSLKVLILNKDTRLFESIKLYLKDNYDVYSIITDITQKEFEDYVKAQLYITNPNANYTLIIEGAYKSLIAKSERLNLDTDKKFLDFKNELSSNNTKVIKEKEAILYVFSNRGWRDKRNFKRLSQAIQYIKDLKKGIILTNMDADDFIFSTLARLKDYVYIKARKDIVADLRALNMKCLVDINWLLKEDPMLSIVATINHYFPIGLPSEDIRSVNFNLPEDLSKEFNRLLNIYRSFGINDTYLSIIKNLNPPLDQYTEYLCLRLKNYIEKHKEARKLACSSGCENAIITTAVIVKTKAYRVSGEAYERVRNNNLIKVLCRK